LDVVTWPRRPAAFHQTEDGFPSLYASVYRVNEKCSATSNNTVTRLIVWYITDQPKQIIQANVYIQWKPSSTVGNITVTGLPSRLRRYIYDGIPYKQYARLGRIARIQPIHISTTATFHPENSTMYTDIRSINRVRRT